jgi:hypothetical protein
MQVKGSGVSGQIRELLSISIEVDGTWQPAISASSVHVRVDIGTFEQRVHLTPDSGVLDVSTRLRLKDGISVHSVEHRYDFPPPRHIDRLRYF